MKERKEGFKPIETTLPHIHMYRMGLSLGTERYGGPESLSIDQTKKKASSSTNIKVSGS